MSGYEKMYDDVKKQYEQKLKDVNLNKMFHNRLIKTLEEAKINLNETDFCEAYILNVMYCVDENGILYILDEVFTYTHPGTDSYDAIRVSRKNLGSINIVMEEFKEFIEELEKSKYFEVTRCNMFDEQEEFENRLLCVDFYPY